MSLLDIYSEDFILMEKTRVPDGEGGVINTWSEGVTFSGAMTLDTSIEAQIASAQKETTAYTLTVSRNMSLDYHDVFKAVKDGAIYRTTSASGDNKKKTPKSTNLDMNQVTCERWGLN